MCLTDAPRPPPPPPPSPYITFTSGASCEANEAFSIRTPADCEAAAAALGLSDTTAYEHNHWSTGPRPIATSSHGELYFSSAGTNTGECSENHVCICRAPDGGGRGGDTALTLATEGGGGGDAVAIALPIIAVLVVLGLLVAVLVYWKRKRAAAGAPAEPTAVEISVTTPPQLPATSSSNVVEGMPVSATEVPPPVRAPSATAAAAMLVDSTGDGLADAVHVDTTGDGRPDTIVPLGESAHARPLNASDMELEVRELRKSIAETKRQRSLTRQALEDALRAGGGESNTSVGGPSAVAGEPVPRRRCRRSISARSPARSWRTR